MTRPRNLDSPDLVGNDLLGRLDLLVEGAGAVLLDLLLAVGVGEELDLGAVQIAGGEVELAEHQRLGDDGAVGTVEAAALGLVAETLHADEGDLPRGGDGDGGQESEDGGDLHCDAAIEC